MIVGHLIQPKPEIRRRRRDANQEPVINTDPEARVLNGKTSAKEAMELDGQRLPSKNRHNTLRPGEELDPVLRHHLRINF